MVKQTIVLTLLVTSSVFANEQDVKQVELISESMGHLIGKNLKSLSFKFNLEKVIQGIKNSSEGKEPPLNEEQCTEAIAMMQEKAFHEESDRNLKEADDFLSQNKVKKGIVLREDGKLQYRTEKEGSGETVQKTNSPLVRYQGKYLDGTTFGSSEEGELITLDETIPGFRKGILGMKEGEKRTIYIHPDLGYGTNGFVKPNSLLTFEVEVIQADGTHTNEITDETSSSELANPSLENTTPY